MLRGSARTEAPRGDWRLWVSLAQLQPPRAQRHRRLPLTRWPWGSARPEPAIPLSVPPPQLGRAFSSSWSSPRYFQLGPLPTSLGPCSLFLTGQDQHTLSAWWLASQPRPRTSSCHPPLPTLICGLLTLPAAPKILWIPWS